MLPSKTEVRQPDTLTHVLRFDEVWAVSGDKRRTGSSVPYASLAATLSLIYQTPADKLVQQTSRNSLVGNTFLQGARLMAF